MIGANKFLVTLTVSLAVYFISDFFFYQSMLYVLGAIIWGVFGEDIGFFSGLSIGFLMLVGSIFLFYKKHNKLLKVLAIIMITAFLYIIDFFRIEMFSMSSTNKAIALAVISKGLILSLIIYLRPKAQSR